MKRSPLPPRSTPLRARTGLARVAGLVRKPMARPNTPMPAYQPTMTAAELGARSIMAARSGGVCEGCRRAAATDWSHRKPRSQGGPWCPSNGLHLCRDCHAWIHHNPIEAYSVGWGLRSTTDPATTPALLAVHGWVLLTTDGNFTPTGEAV